MYYLILHYTDIPEAPPDYFSVVASRIQTARRETNSLSAFCAKAFRTIFFLSKHPYYSSILILMLMYECVNGSFFSCRDSGSGDIDIHTCWNAGHWYVMYAYHGHTCSHMNVSV